MVETTKNDSGARGFEGVELESIAAEGLGDCGIVRALFPR